MKEVEYNESLNQYVRQLMENPGVFKIINFGKCYKDYTSFSKNGKELKDHNNNKNEKDEATRKVKNIEINKNNTQENN